MQIEAKRELAQAYMQTIELHEGSYDLSEGYGKYDKGWYVCATEACTDPDLVPLVYAMAAGGYVDYHDWATAILAKAEA